MRKHVAEDLRSIFNAPDRYAAEERLKAVITAYEASAPDLATWMEANVPESHTVFDIPPKVRRRLRTTNLLERISKEFKRRTRVATLLPNPESLLRLSIAVLMEISEEWETGRAYIHLEAI